MPTQLIVTTSHKARPETIRRAHEFAAAHQYDFVPRGDDSVEDLLGSTDAALVVANGGVIRIATAHGSLAAHLGTGYIRLKSLSRGDGDPLVRAGEIGSGDHVVDTTFGLGRDAIVAACAAGPNGQITAIESSDALFHLGQHGLTDGPLSPSEVAKVGDHLLAAPIQLVHGEAMAWLRAAEANSADVVLIDPMFDSPRSSDKGFELLRSLADASPLTADWVAEARRVARRWVVIKTGTAPAWFTNSGVQRVHSHSNATWWRV